MIIKYSGFLFDHISYYITECYDIQNTLKVLSPVCKKVKKINTGLIGKKSYQGNLAIVERITRKCSRQFLFLRPRSARPKHCAPQNQRNSKEVAKFIFFLPWARKISITFLPRQRKKSNTFLSCDKRN